MRRGLDVEVGIILRSVVSRCSSLAFSAPLRSAFLSLSSRAASPFLVVSFCFPRFSSRPVSPHLVRSRPVPPVIRSLARDPPPGTRITHRRKETYGRTTIIDSAPWSRRSVSAAFPPRSGGNVRPVPLRFQRASAGRWNNTETPLEYVKHCA